MISGGVDNHNPRVQKHIFGDIFLEKQFFVLILGLWAKLL